MANKSVPPKGKVKGGARFPRHSLEQALPWIKKLVSKTHGGPMPADMIMAGVVEAKGPRGEIKISALRQFDLIEGDTKGYSHTRAVFDRSESWRDSPLSRILIQDLCW